MEINGTEYTIGADPEVFMSAGGKFVSAHDAIPGTKARPHVVNHGAVQVDGMALEFNIDPAKNYQEFQDNLDSVQATLKSMIGDCDFMTQASVEFDEVFEKSVPRSALTLGCSADYNGWTMDEMNKPNSQAKMRTAGGHVHIGGFFADDPFEIEHYVKSARLSRILDYTLGVYSILWDSDDKRRSLYGQAGAFRPKRYGMEYRTLSNKWIFNKNVVQFVYDSVVEALQLSQDESFEPDDKVIDIINNSDRSSDFFKNNDKADYARSLA